MSTELTNKSVDLKDYDIRLVHFVILNFIAQKKKVRAKEILTELEANNFPINMHKLYTLLDRLENEKLIESKLTNTTPPCKELSISLEAELYVLRIQRILESNKKNLRTGEKPPIRLDDPMYRGQISSRISKLVRKAFFGDMPSYSPTDSTNVNTLVDEVLELIKAELVKLREVPLKIIEDKDRKKLK